MNVSTPLSAMRLPFRTTDWRILPNSAAVGGDDHIFAIGDIHGQARLLEPLLEYVKMIRKPPKKFTKMIFTGDLIDRGPENIRTVELAYADDGFDQTIVLPENHELMMFESTRERYDPSLLNLWVSTGGVDVINEARRVLHNGSDEAPMYGSEIRSVFPEDYINMIENGPPAHTSGDVTFVHAGIDPVVPMEKTFEWDRFDYPSGLEHWAWTRRAFIDHVGPWSSAPSERHVIVHGHTVEQTQPLGRPSNPEFPAYEIERNQRINIDAGAYYFQNLVCVEMIEDKYRFHIHSAR